MFEPAHYRVKSLDSMQFVRERWSRPPDDLNWIFVDTGGVHGEADGGLDRAERTLRGEPDPLEDIDDDTGLPLSAVVTVLIVQPRLCTLWYGCLDVSLDDCQWLRERVRMTAAVIGRRFGNY